MRIRYHRKLRQKQNQIKQQDKQKLDNDNNHNKSKLQLRELTTKTFYNSSSDTKLDKHPNQICSIPKT